MFFEMLNSYSYGYPTITVIRSVCFSIFFASPEREETGAPSTIYITGNAFSGRHIHSGFCQIGKNSKTMATNDRTYRYTYRGFRRIYPSFPARALTAFFYACFDDGKYIWHTSD